MIFQDTAQKIKQAGQMSETFVGWCMTPPIRFAILQWTTVCLVSLLLGLFVVIATSASVGTMVFFLGLVIVPFILITIGNLQKLLLAVILLEITIQLDINIGFQEEVAFLDTVSGFNFSVTTICLIFLYAWWFAEIVIKKAAPLPPSLFRMSLPLLVYLTVVILSMVFARYAVLSLFEINILIQSLLLYFYIIHVMRTRQDLLFIVTFLLLGLLLQDLIIIGLRIVGHTVEILVIKGFVEPGSMRVGGTIGSPNGAGSYIAMMLIVAFSLMITLLGRWYKRLAAIAFGLGLVALFLTGSRGAWISLAFALSLFWLLAWSRGWLTLKIPVVLSVFAIPILIVFSPMIITRIFGNDGGSAASRLHLMRLALSMIADYWLFGVGSNNFAANMGDYITPEFSAGWNKTVHNKYLLVWTETGIFGLITFVWFLVATIKQGWRVWKLNDRLLSPLVLGFSLALVAWMMHMALDLFHNRVHVQLLLLVAGIITAIFNIRRADLSEV